MIALANRDRAQQTQAAILLTMCGRYYRQADKQAIAEHFAANVYDFELPDRYNIAPQSTQPVVRVNRDTGEREVALMR